MGGEQALRGDGVNIVIASAFRNASAYIARYRTQVGALCPALRSAGHAPRLLLTYGVSEDDTGALLMADGWPAPCRLLANLDGGPMFGSIDTRERWSQLARVWNALLAEVEVDADIFMLVESDLQWDAETIVRVMGHLGDGIDGCTAMVRFEGRFYDTFGHRRDGVRFSTHPPYHSLFPSSGLMEMDSGGSLWIVKATYARGAHFSDEQGIVGWCNNMRAIGAHLWLDTDAWIEHPPYAELRARGNESNAARHASL
jgi:hypothetical protein